MECPVAGNCIETLDELRRIYPQLISQDEFLRETKIRRGPCGKNRLANHHGGSLLVKSSEIAGARLLGTGDLKTKYDTKTRKQDFGPYPFDSICIYIDALFDTLTVRPQWNPFQPNSMLSVETDRTVQGTP